MNMQERQDFEYESGLTKNLNTRVGYKGRSIAPDPLVFASQDLNTLVFCADLKTVTNAGFPEIVICNWVNHMLGGTIPTMDNSGLSRRFSTFAEFESHVQNLFNGLSGYKKRAIRRYSKRS